MEYTKWPFCAVKFCKCIGAFCFFPISFIFGAVLVLAGYISAFLGIR